MSGIPCENCLILAICKNKALSLYRGYIDLSSLLTCSLFENYAISQEFVIQRVTIYGRAILNIYHPAYGVLLRFFVNGQKDEWVKKLLGHGANTLAEYLKEE